MAISKKGLSLAIKAGLKETFNSKHATKKQAELSELLTDMAFSLEMAAENSEGLLLSATEADKKHRYAALLGDLADLLDG